MQAGNIFGDIVLGRTTPDINEWAEGLAQGVRMLWRREEEHRQIHDPVALPVRWHPASIDLSDHWDNVHRTPAGATAQPLTLHGRIENLATVYRSVPSGRLVILGRAGAGKTVLAARLTLDLLATRVPGDPVPVIVSAGSWNPAATALNVWLAEQLARDHPGLAATAGPGRRTRAEMLIDAERVLPVLDGFDEIDAGLHAAALNRLNTTPDLPVVITSRAGEYTAAVHGADVLTAAAVIELDDLTVEDLAAYLPRTVAGPRTGMWDPVLDRLRTEPDTAGAVVVRETLNNPLMVFLARTIYSDTPGHDPTELLDTHRYPTTETLQEYLLAAFVPAVYQANHVHSARAPRWDTGRAHRYLTYLADHLHRAGTHDLAWWQLRDTVPRWRRTLIFGAADGLILATAVILYIGLFSWFFFPRDDTVLSVMVLETLLAGGLTGVAATIMSTLTVATMIGSTAVLRQFSRRFNISTDRSSRTPVALMSGLEIALITTLIPLLFWPASFQAGFITFALAFTAGVMVWHVGPRRVGPRPMLSRLQIRGQLWFICARTTFGFAAGCMISPIFSLAYLRVFWPNVIIVISIGIIGAFIFAIAFGLEAPADATDVTSAAQSVARDRRNALRKILVFSVGGVACVVVMVPSRHSVSFDGRGTLGPVMMTLAYLSVRTNSAWIYWLVLARGWLPLTGRLPWRVQAFLDDAYQRGVLRQTGAVYQFRHARLQHQLITPSSTKLTTEIRA